MQYCHLKTLHMHDLAKNASGEGKIILPLFFSLFFFYWPFYQKHAPESAPLLAKQPVDLISDTVIMQSLLCFLSSHLHLLMHSASPVQFLKMAIKRNTISRKLIIVSLTTSPGAARETAAGVKVRYTPCRPLPPPHPLKHPVFALKQNAQASPSVQAGGEGWWLARRSQCSPSQASETHRQGFPPAMRAKPSQPSDQGPAICD